MAGKTNVHLSSSTALLIIDVQKAIDQPTWSEHGPRNNPDAEQTMARVLERWRDLGRPIVHIRHDSQEESSTYSVGTPSHAFKTEVVPQEGETVIGKGVNSAFVGTGLEEHLRSQGIEQLVIMGVITNNSVETSVRHAGNLGFDCHLVEDACFTFAFPDFSGKLRSAQEVHDMSLANMDGEYCKVIHSNELLKQ